MQEPGLHLFPAHLQPQSPPQCTAGSIYTTSESIGALPSSPPTDTQAMHLILKNECNFLPKVPLLCEWLSAQKRKRDYLFMGEMWIGPKEELWKAWEMMILAASAPSFQHLFLTSGPLHMLLAQSRALLSAHPHLSEVFLLLWLSTNYPNTWWLKTKITISYLSGFLWVRNSGVAQLGHQEVAVGWWLDDSHPEGFFHHLSAPQPSTRCPGSLMVSLDGVSSTPASGFTRFLRATKVLVSREPGGSDIVLHDLGLELLPLSVHQGLPSSRLGTWTPPFDGSHCPKKSTEDGSYIDVAISGKCYRQGN